MKTKQKERKIKEEFEEIMNEKIDIVKVAGEDYSGEGIDKITGKYFHDKLWSWFEQKLKEREKEVRILTLGKIQEKLSHGTQSEDLIQEIEKELQDYLDSKEKK